MDELTPPPKILSLLGLPLNQRGQVLLDDVSTTASLVVDLSHLLDGMITSGSSSSAFLSRFSRLRTSRSGGDNVVSRTTSAVGLDDTECIIAPTSVYNCQRTTGVLCRPAPGQSRFRANGSHQFAVADRLPLGFSTSACQQRHFLAYLVLLARRRLSSGRWAA
jgi:hypothetical protein